ncbi:MAG: right-handed parallel beta-helix repeat-containing protein [Sedimentisphaerales bacterium]
MKKFNLKTAIQCVVLVCALTISSQVSMAGNLEPNAPPASTMKPLDQVEPRIAITTLPFTILASGSYYLVSDLTASGGNGITVDANNVTIDLCGFSLIGYNGNGYGVYMLGRSNVEIRNGTIRNFYTGIYEGSTNGFGDRVIGVRAISNTDSGIYLLGKGNEVRGCTVSYNGISASGSSIYGIFANNGSTVTGNTVSNNATLSTTGFFGIITGTGSTITGNTVNNNGTSLAGVWFDGLSGGTGCTITGNTVSNNGNSATGSYTIYGLDAGAGSTVIGNTVNSNGISATGGTLYGIYLEGHNLVDQNTAYNNNGTNMNNPGNCTFGQNYAP